MAPDPIEVGREMIASAGAYRSTLLVLGLLLGAAGGACARSSVASSAGGAGEWLGTDGNLEVRMTLAVAGDSISGEGSYTLRDPGALGCGGETLPPSGRVSLAGSHAKGQFGGRFRFADGAWTPPFVAAWVPPDTLRGGFMSVDRGRCPLLLVRRR